MTRTQLFKDAEDCFHLRDWVSLEQLCNNPNFDINERYDQFTLLTIYAGHDQWAEGVKILLGKKIFDFLDGRVAKGSLQNMEQIQI